MTSSEEITTLLVHGRGGDRKALDALFPLVYRELRRRAQQYLVGERTGHTLSATALVHEAYVRLVDLERVDWQDRAHFVAVASRAMRRILIDHARKHAAAKRGAAQPLLSLDDAALLSQERSEQILALDDALDRLARLNERLSRNVELRYFGGLTFEETGVVLGIAPSTAKLDWRKAKAWLYRELRNESAGAQLPA